MRLTLFLLLLLTIGCAKMNESNIELHPLEARLPYSNLDLKLISKIEPDTSVATLKKFFPQIDNYSERTITINLKGDEHIVELPNNKLVFGGRSVHHITTLNLTTGEQVEISSSGRGPGDVLQINDLDVRGNSIHVVMNDGRYAEFTCSTEPCSHLTTLQFDANLFSVSAADRFTYILQSSGISGGVDDGSSFNDSERIFVLSDNDVYLKFGEGYDYTDRNMLRLGLDSGVVSTTSSFNTILVAYNRLPFIYRFNSEGVIVEKFAIHDFIQGYNEYNLVDSFLKNVETDFSEIIDMVDYEDKIFLTVKNNRNKRIESSRFVWDTTYDYYVYDLILSEWRFIDSSSQFRYYILNGKLFSTNGESHKLIY